MKKFYLSELEKIFHIPASKIRYYDDHGLLPFMQRDASGKRYIDQADIGSLSLVMFLKHAGCSLHEIEQIVRSTEIMKGIGTQGLDEKTDHVTDLLNAHIDSLLEQQTALIDQINVTRYLLWSMEMNRRMQYVRPDKLDDFARDSDYKGPLPNYIHFSELTLDGQANEIWQDYQEKYNH